MDYKIPMKKNLPKPSPRPAFVIENKKSRVLGKIHSLAPGGRFIWKTEDLDPGFLLLCEFRTEQLSINRYMATGID
jgi:hypothetical protein